MIQTMIKVQVWHMSCKHTFTVSEENRAALLHAYGTLDAARIEIENTCCDECTPDSWYHPRCSSDMEELEPLDRGY